MENKENDKRKGATQNNVESDNPIANNVENDTDKKENSSPEKKMVKRVKQQLVMQRKIRRI